MTTPDVPSNSVAETQLSDLVESFLGGLKPSTVRAYRSDLGRFAAFLEAEDMNQAAETFLGLPYGSANLVAHDWRAHMLDVEELSPATVNRRLSSLRSLVKMANRVGLVPWTLSAQSVKSRAYRDTTGPGRPTVEAMVHHLAAEPTRKAVRDLAIIRLLFDRGLRRGEAVLLDLADINLDRRRIRVTGKGHREAEWLTIAAPTALALKQWINERGSEAGPLFTSMGRGPGGSGRLSGRSVADIVHSAGVAVGIPGVRPHGLRHTAITEVLDRTDGNVRAARRFSRHAKLDTLMIYDDNSSDMGGEMAELIAVT